MAFNMSDDEDIDFQRQRFQHPDDPDDVEMDDGSGSDSDAEQRICLQRFITKLLPHSLGIKSKLQREWTPILNLDKGLEADDLPPRPPRDPRRDRIPLHHFLRLIGGGRVVERDIAFDNDELVSNLKRSGTITDEAAVKAMRVCARNLFVPEQHQDEAFTDSPVRLEELDFNVSAPHMHASCLEALQLQPGHRLLDVGCGCGIINACGAYIVGKTGLSVGIDIRRSATRLAASNIKRLRSSSQDFASQAAACKIELHNVFMPSNKHQGQYDRVHVGASCPPDRLRALLSLLRPEGGKIITPVCNDLRLITVDAEGEVTQERISQVRYSDLEVPSDADIIMAAVKLKRREQTAVDCPPSTYAEDVATITSSTGYSCSSGSDQSSFMMASSEKAPEVERSESSGSRRLWGTRVAKFLSSCSGSLASSEAAGVEEAALQGAERSSPAPARLDPAELGPTDLVMIGNGWTIPVHRHVVNNRSELCRARRDSGMRDADGTELHVPEHFSKDAVETFLHYLYFDKLDPRSSPQHVMAVLHVAHYYGAAHLVGLCEAMLAQAVKKGDQDDDSTHEAAAALLALADESGLPKLRAVCLDYIVHHYGAVAATENFKTLNSHQRNMIAAEACAMYTHVQSLLQEVATRKPLPEF